MATLANIRTLVRNLTRAPSEAQLSTADIDESVNNFILYDLPNRIRPLDLRRTFTFYTSPYVDTYATNTVDPTSPLYDFKNRYVNVMNPFYVAGFPAVLTQSRELFWSMYPQQQFVTTLPSLGDGVRTNFVGTLSYAPAVYQGTVTFTSEALDGLNIVANTIKDVPNYLANGIMGTTGQFFVPDQLAPAWGTINYVTGAYNITFPVAPRAGSKITVEYLSYVPGRPYNILFFNDTFYVRPVPDRAYPITMDVTVKPLALVNAGQVPEIDQWWQYMAYGGAIKILQRRLDDDTVNLIMPEFLEQQALCMRKTLIQNTSKRSATIFNQPTNFRYGYGWPTDWNFF